MMIRISITIIFALIIHFCTSDKCPDNKDCPEACCPSGSEYYCCSRNTVSAGGGPPDGVYLVGWGSVWRDYWALFIGLLILGLVISIICSVVCCLYCNGCLWHRRRNPDLYAGAFPLGTIIYSPWVGPQIQGHHPPSYYDESPDSSVRSGGSGHNMGNRRGVRFDQDTMVKTVDHQTPKSALKKPSPNGGVAPHGGRGSPNLLL